MIVFCEDCGERNVIDIDKLGQDASPPRCRSCNDILKISTPHMPPKKKETIKKAIPAPSQLVLRYGSRTIAISQTRPTVTMGRQEHNDLEVIDTRVSRSHARIEFRHDRFVLIDNSTNGTYVLIKGRQGINLKRKELPLEGNGYITLGRKVSSDSSKAIHFSIK